MKKIPLYFLVLIFGLLQACGQVSAQKYNYLYKNTVPLVKPSQLDSMLQQGEKPVLLDARSPREYEVSHIKNAQFVDYDHFNLNDVQDIPKDQPIVVYCSVGVRSEKTGEKLLKAGYEHVYNLYGGIFEWKNEDHPVYDMQQQKTDSVHAYNWFWGRWLKKGIKVYE